MTWQCRCYLSLLGQFIPLHHYLQYTPPLHYLLHSLLLPSRPRSLPSTICISTLLTPTRRWLIANGQRQEAIDILCKLRGDLSPEDPVIASEVEQLDAIVEATHHKRNDLANIVLGGRFSGKLHLGRRAVLGFALQWIQQWTGILAIVGWAGVLFELAGFDPYKALWLAGLANTFGVPGTAAAAFVIDRMGRVKSLITSFIIQGVCLFLVGALIKTSQDHAISDPELSQRLGTAAASFVFIYVW